MFDLTAILFPLVAGWGVGILLGALGAGGSVLTVPLFVFGMNMPVKTAAAASLVVVAAMAGTGALAHVRERSVRVREAVVLSGLAAVGSFFGAWALTVAQKESFFLGFTGLLLLGAAALWRVPMSDSEAQPLPDRAIGGFPDARLGTLGLGVGFLTGFFGVGGGFLIVPGLVTFLRFPMRQAVGTSLFVVTAAALAGLASHLREPLPWAQVLPFAAMGVWGAWSGQRLAKRIQTHLLRKVFAVGLVGLAAFLVMKTS